MLVFLTFRRNVVVSSSTMYHNALELHILSQAITRLDVLTAISEKPLE